jgi:hypothetical protein
MKTKTITILQYVILLFIVIFLNIPLLIVAQFGLWVNNELEVKVPPELTEKLNRVHSKRIKSDDPEVLRKHAQSIWKCFQATEEERLNISQIGNQFYIIVINFMLFELFLFSFYYILHKIKRRKSQQIDSCNQPSAAATG